MNSELQSQTIAEPPEFLNLCKYFSERSPQPMIAVGGENHIIRYVNPAFAKLISKSLVEMIGKPITEIVPEIANNGCYEILDRILATGTSEILAEQLHSNTTLAYWSYSMWPIVGELGIAAGVMIQVTDVTGIAVFRLQMTEMNQALAASGMRQHELTETGKKLNLKLTSATQAKSLFLANMSHEIRTPLGAILGYCDLLREPGLSEDERARFIDTIDRNGLELTRIVDDILDLSKVEAECLEIERCKVSLFDLIADIQSSLFVTANSRSIGLSFESAGSVPQTIETDYRRLRQILLNIVGNAIKFTESGGVKVTVKLLPSVDLEAHVAFIVEDTGCGISQEGQRKLFNNFSQADSSTTRKFGGTGLGLVLSRNLARALGGNIELLSSAADKGSSFVVTIAIGRIDENTPLTTLNDRDSSRTPRKVKLAGQDLAGVKVLLADDAYDNRILIARILTNNGASVDTACNGLEAVDKALHAQYDVVLMDIQMPELDGYAATAQLRSRGYLRPIIALTAHALIEEREKTKIGGFNEHLTKPINTKSLVETISRFSVTNTPANLH